MIECPDTVKQVLPGFGQGQTALLKQFRIAVEKPQAGNCGKSVYAVFDCKVIQSAGQNLVGCFVCRDHAAQIQKLSGLRKGSQIAGRLDIYDIRGLVGGKGDL